MNHTTCPPSIEAPAIARLTRALDAALAVRASTTDPAGCAAFASCVRAALAEAAADPALLSLAQRQGSLDRYRRHLLAADPCGRYAIAALVWHPGQASPVHAHHTWCGYAVVDGVLAETVYRWDVDAHCAVEARTQLRRRGAVSFTRAGHGGIHRLGNLAARGTASGEPAVSLHLYGVTGAQIATHVNDIVRVDDSRVALAAVQQTTPA
ncbi:cysteine dioxygenase family protein [Paraburkholderia acidicola]|uniref:Cysteine dioxygenase family protein n=1 Tax=Paraburkholderia acidicola TaxID=1912599 RepID=A0ABV1LFK2_9BURK